MKTTATLLIAAALTASLPAIGIAQQAQPPAATAPSGNTMTGGKDLAGDMDTLLGAIPSDGANVVQNMTTVGTLTVVRVPALADAEKNRLDDAIAQNESQISTLRTALRSNKALSAALASLNVSIDSVVAVREAGNGQLIVYAQG